MLYFDGLLGIVTLGLWIFCLVDVITTDDLSTRVWAWRSADALDEACRRLARHITEAQWPPVTGVSFQATIDRVCGASQR